MSKKMKKIYVSFYGRKVGSQGSTYKINTSVELPVGSDSDDIRKELYKSYEHIFDFRIYE